MASQHIGSMLLGFGPFSRNLPGYHSLPWKKSKKTLGEPDSPVERFLQPSVAAARRRSIGPARRGGPPFSDPFGRCGLDLIKPTTSQKSHLAPTLPPPSRLPKHPLPKPSPQQQPQPQSPLAPARQAPGTSLPWRRRCSSAPCAEGSSRPLSDP